VRRFVNYFWWSHLAYSAREYYCLDIIESQSLMENAKKVEEYFMEAIKIIPEIIKVKGED
jgi:acetylornithine aminotransferase